MSSIYGFWFPLGIYKLFLNDHLSYVTIFHRSIGRSHQTDLTVYENAKIRLSNWYIYGTQNVHKWILCCFFLICGFCVKWKYNGGKNVALFWAYEQMFSLPHEIWGIMDSDEPDNFALQGAMHQQPLLTNCTYGYWYLW